MSPRSARQQVGEVLARTVHVDISAGELAFVGAGEDYAVFAADLRHQIGQEVVIRIPREGVGDSQRARARRAVAVQRLLADREEQLPFAVPVPVGVADVDNGLAVVETKMPGVELGQVAVDEGLSAAEITARMAAACHQLDPAPFRPLPGESDGSESQRSRLLHGDLLAQNILVDIDGGKPTVSVVDWDRVRLGDPSRELAAVIRGDETVFGTGETAGDLLEAYNRRVPWSVELADVLPVRNRH